jgi:hypothetical protein
VTEFTTGIQLMPAEVYHADPCPEPSLSASIAKKIWQQSPQHAAHAHPRLNPQKEEEHKAAFDLGTACHDVLLEGGTGKIEVIEAADWRTKAAKEARDAAYDAGLVPLLPHQADRVQAMSGAAMKYIEQTELAGILDDGLPEQTMIATWNSVWLRGRTDWLTGDRKIIMDYKTVGQSANPEDFSRTALFKLGHDIQAAMYQLLNGLTGGPTDAAFVWLVQEVAEPYACSLVGASPSIFDIGDAKLAHCIEAWQTGIKSGVWPGYGPRIAYPDVPPWEVAKVEEMMQGVAA